MTLRTKPEEHLPDSSFEVRLLQPGEEAVLSSVAAEVFDDAVDLHAAREFLADPRHHLAVALADGVVIGFASGLHYVHPDKPSPELWINEVGVSPAHHRRGVGKALLQTLFEAAGRLGCREAWVLTERSNPPAMGLYRSLGGEEAPEDAVMFTIRLDVDHADAD